MSAIIRIGTRGSALALAQANWVRAQLEAHHPGVAIELVIIKTSGDRFVDQPLSRLGGKGLFVKEIEDALLAGNIDCAVHSMKDLPGDLPPGLTISAVPPRADPRDVLITHARVGFAELARGARVGTSSLRRAALLRHLRPDLQIHPLRGNVDSRLRRVDAGELDAVVLAAAGLSRLGIVRADADYFDPRQFVPAIGQGALAIETRADHIATLIAVLEHAATRAAVTAERAFMIGAGGSCHTPLAAYATLSDHVVRIHALIASTDGARIVNGERHGDAAAAADLGADLAAELLAAGGAEILAGLRTADASTASAATPRRNSIDGR